MKTTMNPNFQATAISISQSRPSIAREIRIVAFPREFQKDFFKSIDRRMLMAFVLSLLFVYGPLAYQASQPRQISTGTGISTKILKKLGQVMRVDPRLLLELDKPKIENETRTNQSLNTTVNRVGRTNIRGNATDRLNRANQARSQAANRVQNASSRAMERGLLAVVGTPTDGNGRYSSVDLTHSNVNLDDVLNRIDRIETAENGDSRTILGDQRMADNRNASITELTGLLGENQTLSVVAGDASHGIIGVGNASVTGSGRMGASAADFQAVFEQQAMAINACYTKELKRTPDIKGKLSVQIKINPVGIVSGIQLTENTVGNAVGQCVQNKIRSWKFPKGHKGMVTISQTFVFSR